MSWRDDAACRGLWWWFQGEPRPYAGSDAADVRKQKWEARRKQVCAVCPVREKCLEEALENDEPVGIWGGKTPEERRAMGARPERIRGRRLDDEGQKLGYVNHGTRWAYEHHGCRCFECRATQVAKKRGVS